MAPPVEMVNQCLPLLGRIAMLGREPGATHRLTSLASVEAILAYFQQIGV